MTEKLWDTTTLERHLVEAGGELSDELCQRILAQGEGIVPALIEVLNREDLQMEDAPGEGWPPIHAADLLGQLKAVEAVPHLVRWLVEAERMTFLKERLPRILGEIGEPAFAPLLAAYRQREEADDRAYFLEALARVGHRDDELYQLFLRELEENPVLGAVYLGEYGDPRAVAPLTQALDAWQLSEDSTPFDDDAVIEFAAAIRDLGGELSAAQEQKVEMVRQRRIRLFERRTSARSPYLQQSRHPGSAAKLGRNEPCWCGSGKKYKKCHLDEDQRTHDEFEDY